MGADRYYYVANFLVLRMFIALILENFEYDDDTKVRIQIQLYQRTQILMNDLIDGRAREISLEEQFDRLRKQNLDEQNLKSYEHMWSDIVRDRAAEQGGGAASSQADPNAGFLWNVLIEAAARKEEALAKEVKEFQGLYLLLVQAVFYLRKSVYSFVENQIVDFIVLLAVIFSVVLVQIDTKEAPIFEPETRALIDTALLGFFGVETGLKIFAYGLFTQSGVSPRTIEFPKGKPPFVSSTEEGGWNAIDIVVVSMMVLGAFGVDAGGFKCVRIIRIVRPLQKRVMTVKGLVAALIASFAPIFHVINLLVIFIFIFGLIGVNLFRGRFFYCNDASILAGYEECVGTNFGGLPDVPCVVGEELCPQTIGTFLEQPVLVPRVWSAKPENFENLYSASITLLRLLSQDNLRPIFHSTMDIPTSYEYLCPGTNEDATNGCPEGGVPFTKSLQPVLDEMPQNIIFPITYVFLANIFISQMVIGVLIDNIRRQTGSALYTQEQRVWRATKMTMDRLTLKLKPEKPDNPLRLFLYEALDSQQYEVFIMTIIILNTLMMATDFDPPDRLWLTISDYVGWCFLTIYVVETIAKIIAFGVISWSEEDTSCMKSKSLTSPYFRDPWSSFDFFVVLMSVLDSAGLINQPVFKLLRVLRTLRLVRRVPVLQMMLTTLIGARTAIMSALLFLGIWIFIMSAVGSDPQWFAHLKHGSVIDATWNFEGLMNSMFLLFRTTTGDGWFDLIYDSQVAPPFCTNFVPAGATLANGAVLEKDDLKGDCGMGAVGVVYFVIFYLICNFILLPLFVATLIDYFFEAEVDSISLFNNDDCDLYADVWSVFDEEGDGKISIENLRPLIDRLGARRHPAGFNTSSDMERFKAIWARVFR